MYILICTGGAHPEKVSFGPSANVLVAMGRGHLAVIQSPVERQLPGSL